MKLKEVSHPFLFLTPKEIQRLKVLAQEPGTYQQGRFVEIRGKVAKWFADPLTLPRRGAEGALLYSCEDDGHGLIYDPSRPGEHECPQCGKIYRGEVYDGWWRAMVFHDVAYAARDVALFYAVTGEPRYGEEAARILLGFADLAPTLPVKNLAYLGREALDEVRIVLALAPAYDLICDAGLLTDDQKRHIEADYFRPTAELMQIGDYMWLPEATIGNNFQATIIAGIGAVGLLLRDVELVEFAIHGPVGFHRLMTKGVLDNGMWWESSSQYHMAVVKWLLYLSEAAWRSGINLYDNDRYRLMYTLPQRLMCPDGVLPVINDGVFGNDTVTKHRTSLQIYFTRTRDHGVEYLLQPGELVGDTAWNWAWDLTLALEPTWAAAEAPKLTSVALLPNTAILRSDGDPQIHVQMDVGPHGGSHGHADALGIVVHANGRLQAPDFGNGGCYSLAQWSQWYKQTVAHNTVVPGGKSIYPCTGRLNRMYLSPRAKIMDGSAATDDYSNEVDQDLYGYPHCGMRRIVALLDESFIVDLFRVRSGQECDWVYHNYGTLHTDEPMEAQAGPLGDTCGYQYVERVRRGRARGNSWRAEWRADGQGMRLTVVGAEAFEFITGEGYGERIDKRVAMVVVRSGPGLPVFQTVLEPFTDKPKICSARQIPCAWPARFPEGPQQGTTPGTGIYIEKDDGRRFYWVNAFCWGSKTYGDITTDAAQAHLAYDREGEAPSSAVLIDGTTLTRGPFSVQADRAISFHAARQEGGEYLLQYYGDEDVNVEAASCRVQRIGDSADAEGLR